MKCGPHLELTSEVKLPSSRGWAPGLTLEGARAEAGTTGLLARAAERQIRVVPFIIGINGEVNPLLRFLPLLFALLLVPPCANVAVLIYARAVARQGEFAARAALGAGRWRIVGQIFIEALLLSTGAASVALLLASKTTQMLTSLVVLSDRPFWMDFSISYKTIAFAAVLALVAAILAGCIPALRITKRWELAGLHALNRSTAPRLGKGWAAAVVAQVALSVAIVPIVAEFTWSMVRPGIMGPGFQAREFLSARLTMDAGERFDAVRSEVVRQLRVEPGVTAGNDVGVGAIRRTGRVHRSRFGQRPEGRKLESRRPSILRRVFDPATDGAHVRGKRSRPARCDPRQPHPSRSESWARGILWADRVRVIAAKDKPASEYEIAGVVSDLFTGTARPTIYRPLPPLTKTLAEVRVIVRTKNPAIRLRQIAAAVDPALQVDDVQTLDEIYQSSLIPDYIAGTGVAGLVVGLVLFAAAGIYTLMAFAVVQRRREMGIRSALGASPMRLVTGIFQRVLIPIAAGVGAGSVAAIWISYYWSPMLFDYRDRHSLPWILPASEAGVLLIGILAVLGPARRVLRMDLHDAIRGD